MKKILLIDTSPRQGGNSDTAARLLADDLKNEEVVLFTMRDKHCSNCKACGACQGKTTQSCVQADDITPLLPLIDTCDAIAIITPVMNHQMSSQAKLFIERFYPFFNFTMEGMSNTSKRGKKGAMVCSCWGGPVEVYQKYAEWTLESFTQIGVAHTKALVFNQLSLPGAIKARPDYLAQLHSLAKWLAQ